MDTTTMNRKARKQARRLQAEAVHVGGMVKDRATDAGGAVRATAEDLGRRAAERTKGTRQTVGYWIAGERPRNSRTGWVILAGATGAAAAFFLDPVSGRRRRHVARDWVAARFRDAGTGARGVGQAAGADAYGTWRSATHVREASLPENDAILAHKVESEVFRGLDVPSGRINVNAESGVVTLRGTVDRLNQIEELERRTRDVNGVRDVHNLVYLSGAPGA
jgi:osmotically-inducible protein OsmY